MARIEELDGTWPGTLFREVFGVSGNEWVHGTYRCNLMQLENLRGALFYKILIFDNIYKAPWVSTSGQCQINCHGQLYEACREELEAVRAAIEDPRKAPALAGYPELAPLMEALLNG